LEIGGKSETGENASLPQETSVSPLIVGTLGLYMYMYRQAFWRRNDYAQFRSLIAIDGVIDMFGLT